MKDPNNVIIQLEHISKTFRTRASLFKRDQKEVIALKQVSLNIYRGEIFGLVGESGSGKTTTGRLIVKLEEPDDGKLLLDGKDITKIKGKALKNFRKDTLALGGHMKSMPKLVHDILKQTAKGKQRIELQHNGFEEINVQFVKSINRLIVGILISASLIAGAMVLNAPQKMFLFTFEIFGGQKISLSAILGLTGYFFATVLALWLIVMIFRSRKL